MIFVGDIHGNFFEFNRRVVQKEISDSLLIQVGDFGVGFDTPERDRQNLLWLNEQLARRGNRLLVIRGNHDNPAFWGSKKVTELSQIEFAPDYTTKKIEGMDFLFIGGGVSVDKQFRVAGETWWPDEGVRPIPKKKLISDIVVSHIAPNQCFVPRFFGIDSEILFEVVKEAQHERALLGRLFTKMRPSPKLWIYGHYHVSHTTTCGKTKFCGLAEFELKEVQCK